MAVLLDFRHPQAEHFKLQASTAAMEESNHDSPSSPSNLKPELKADSEVASDSCLDEFRNLCLLLTLTTAINDPNSKSRLSIPGLSVQELNQHSSVMHAFASILVREHDILACMAEAGDKPSVQVVVEGDQMDSPVVPSENGDIDDEHGREYGVDVPGGKVKVTAIANPEVKDQAIGCHHCEAIDPGINCWPSLLESDHGWDYLGKEISLADHCATVCGYLNHYRKSKPEQRRELSTRFYQYLTSVTWRKNHQRINRWSAVGVISQFAWANVVPGTMTPLSASVSEAVLEKLEPASDIRLAKRLKELEDQGVLNIIAKSYQSMRSPGFQKLLERCAHQPPVLYAKDTIDEFHHLLVSSLVTYAASLQGLFRLMEARKIKEETRCQAEQSRQDEQRHQEKRNCVNWQRAAKLEVQEQKREEECERECEEQEEEKMCRSFASVVTVVAQLLSSILNSNALQSHFRVLQLSQLFPALYQQQYYEDFASKNNFKPVSLARWGKNRARKRQDSGEANGSPEADNDNEMDDQDEPPDEDDLDQRYHEGVTSTLPDRAVVICGWLKTFTCHYAAKGVLEHHCIKRLSTGPDIQVSLICTQGQKRQVSDWPTMEKVIRCTLQSSQDTYVKEVINYLKHEISKKSGPIFSLFSSLLDGEKVIRHFIMHCEAVLAAFAKHGTDATSALMDSDKKAYLKQLAESLDQQIVAVVRPCCPACWELMAVLRGNNQDQFMVRSRHSMVYPLELPGWLPLDVCQEMVNRFRKHLALQLETMVLGQRNASNLVSFKKMHCRTTSTERDSGLSTATDTSDSSVISGELSNFEKFNLKNQHVFNDGGR